MTSYDDLLGCPPPGFDGESLLRDRVALLDGWSEIYGQPPAPAADEAVSARVARASWYAGLMPGLPNGEILDGIAESAFAVSSKAYPVHCDGAYSGLGNLVRFAFRDLGLGEPTLHPLDRDARQKLAAAVRLIEQVFPRVATNALPCVSVGLVVENPIPSMYLSQTPEVIYVGHRMIERDVWEIADAILHESLHDASELARQVRHLLAPSYVEHASATTLLPWSVKQPTKRYFSTWRLLSACHVYVHLDGFRRSVIGPAADEITVPTERARFMLDQLLASPHIENLGQDGRLFVEWLNTSIDATREVRA